MTHVETLPRSALLSLEDNCLLNLLFFVENTICCKVMFLYLISKEKTLKTQNEAVTSSMGRIPHL